MISVQEAFDKFRQNLEITKTEQADASKRHNQIRDLMRTEFEVKRDILTGSYKRHTKIRPLKDVDIFCILDPAEEGHRRKKPPREVLADIRDVLAQQYDSPIIQRRSVSVEFQRGEWKGEEHVLSMDVVPAFPVNGHYEIPDCVGPDPWIETDPEVHERIATEANDAFNQQWKPIVKMVKKWNAVHEKPISPSFLIEVMAVELLHPPFDGSYAREIKNFMATLSLRLEEVWADPAGLGPPVSDQMGAVEIRNARAVLSETGRSIDRAIVLEQEGSISRALRTWREDVFGDMFPLS